MFLIVLKIERAGKKCCWRSERFYGRTSILINHEGVFNQASKHIDARIICTKMIGEAVL